MEKFQGFQFHHASTELGQVEDIRFRGGSYDRTPEYGKPVQVFHTKGLQIIGVPPELTRILRPEDIHKANRVVATFSAHFETAQRFYLLRVQSTCLMAMPL